MIAIPLWWWVLGWYLYALRVKDQDIEFSMLNARRRAIQARDV